jgi:two-component system response regulator TctD
MTHTCPLCGNAYDDGLTILADRGMVCVGGKAIRLSPTRFSLFRLLFDYRPRVVAKGTILDTLYPTDADEPSAHVIAVMICGLRRKLAGSGITIETHWARGWSLKYSGPKPKILEAMEEATE